MPATCRRCSRPSPDAFLCRFCCDDLRELLTGMAVGTPLRSGRFSRPWLVSLEDAAVGHTRLGESQRHGTDKNSPLPFSESASALLSNVTDYPVEAIDLVDRGATLSETTLFARQSDL